MDERPPFFSVVVPVYNVEPYVRQCIESILFQQETSFELIIIDDGSTDNSGKICDDYSSNPNVRVFHKENGGLANARNYAAPYIRGKYVLYVDSDDYLNTPLCLRNFEKLLNDYPEVDVLAFGHVKYDESIHEYRECLPNIKEEFRICDFSELIRDNLYTISACFMTFRASMINPEILFFDENVLSEDMVWSIRLALCAQKYLVYRTAPYVYRQRANSISHVVSDRNVYDMEGNTERALELIENNIPNNNRMPYYRAIAQHYSMSAFWTAMLPEKCWKEHFGFLEKYRFLLTYGVRRREKLLRIMLAVLGKTWTFRMIGKREKRLNHIK